MSDKNTISYTVISSTGEETFSDVPVDIAVDDIKGRINNNSKWLFVDQNQETADTVTSDKLLSGSVITLTDMLGGG